jgi:hypothetical protein
LVAIISFLNAGGNGSTCVRAGPDASVRKDKSDTTAKVVAADGRINKLRRLSSPGSY